MRPATRVPRAVLMLLAAALSLHIAWQALHARAAPAAAETLAPAPPLSMLRVAALGDPIALSKLTLLLVQAEDAHTGWRTLDYHRLRDWLALALDLDPRGQAPLLAASEVYGAVNDPARVRVMLDFVHARFAEDPDRRWPWLAHAALVARHRLHDLPLARSYAQEIRTRARGPSVPPWAHELELFIATDMGERDSARALIGALLDSGQVSDPRELRFLERRLDSPDAHPP
ncbi:MAG: hypothetical protein ABIT83_03530 [Massilia sp.]